MTAQASFGFVELPVSRRNTREWRRRTAALLDYLSKPRSMVELVAWSLSSCIDGEDVLANRLAFLEDTLKIEWFGDQWWLREVEGE